MGINILNLGRSAIACCDLFLGVGKLSDPKSKVGNGNLQPAGLLASGKISPKTDAAHRGVPVFFFFMKPHVISRSHAFVSWLFRCKTPSKNTFTIHLQPPSPPKKVPRLGFCGDFSKDPWLGWRTKSEIPRGQSCSVSCVPPLEGTSQYFCNQEGVFEGDLYGVFGGCFWWRYSSPWNFIGEDATKETKRHKTYFSSDFS